MKNKEVEQEHVEMQERFHKIMMTKKYKFEVELEFEDDEAFLNAYDEFENLFDKFDAKIKPDESTNVVIVQNSEVQE